MAAQERFAFRTAGEIRERAAALRLAIPWSERADVLLEPFEIGGASLPNRLAALPMEGADADAGGGPGELTFRRYARLAAGGSGLIWFEATAVRPEGRSNPRQLMLTEANTAEFARLAATTRASAANAGEFTRLVAATRAAAESAIGNRRPPLLILQLTHSGRFSRPSGTPAPIIVQHNPHLDPIHGLAPDYPLIEDAELDRLRDDFARAAGLAAEAGFDGVDIKACHGYLVSELLGAHTRTDSRYGGSYENRTRFLRETIAAVRDMAPRLLLTSRVSAADMIPYPYGFGMSAATLGEPDPAEPDQLIGEFRDWGVRLLLYSLGVPAWNPWFGRPYDKPVPGGAMPPEHPLEGVARHVRTAARLQAAFPGLAVVAAGLSWLRHFFPNVAAGMVATGGAILAGMGRGSLAYPDFARDLADRGRMDPRRVCTACSLCSHLLRSQRPVGCPVRNGKFYKAGPE